MKNLKPIIAASLVVAFFSANAPAIAQKPPRQLSGWHEASCKSDPFEDKKFDCSMFLIEDGSAPNEDRAIAIIRVAGGAGGDRYVVQFFSKKNPAKMLGAQLQADFLVRIDKNSTHTFQPGKVFVSKKSDGLIYPTIMLTPELLQEMLQGQTLSVRYIAESGDRITASFLLSGFEGAIKKMAEKVEAIRATAK